MVRTVYEVVAVVVILMLMGTGGGIDPRTRIRGAGGGALMLGIVWPVMPILFLYLAFKTKLLKLRFRDDWVLLLEITGSLMVTGLLVWSLPL